MKTTRIGLLESVVSALSLETALANSHVFVMRVGSYSVLPMNLLMILSAISPLKCILAATGLHNHPSTIQAQVMS
jgi:hypothetical protein